MKRNSLFMLKYLAIVFMVSLACTLSTPENFIKDGIKGSGVIVTQTHPVSGFQRVVFSGVGEFLVTQGQEEALEIEGDDNILALIETKVENQVLYVGLKPGVVNIQASQTVKYRLTVKDLIGLQVAGAGNIEVMELFTGDLDLQINGAGNIKMKSIEAVGLDVLISGAGDCSMESGKADRLKLTISGAGSFHAFNVLFGSADITISGIGSARVWVSELMDVRLSGTGSVEYYGYPRVTQLVTGLGTVKSLGDHP